MKGFKNKKGISLIVLVITIIVMIILAAAIILSISNSGIMDKANKAKLDSDTANLKEYVNVLEAEWELMTESERAGKTSTEYVNDKLKDKYSDAALSADGKVYSGLNANARTAIASGIQIGDTVTGYTLDSSKSSTTTSGKENTAPSEGSNVTQVDTPQTVNQTAYSTWKYIGIGDNGELLIAPEIPTTGTVYGIKLSGKGGFVNGPIELDSVCKALYSTDKGIARSMNMEDIHRMLEYTPPEMKRISDLGITTGQTPETDKDIGDYYENYYYISKTSTDILKSLNTVKNEDVARKSLLLDFVFPGEWYWLASRNVRLYANGRGVAFNLFYIYSSSSDASACFDSTGYSVPTSHSLRPVVQINSNVSVSYNNGTLTLN